MISLAVYQEENSILSFIRVDWQWNRDTISMISLLKLPPLLLLFTGYGAFVLLNWSSGVWMCVECRVTCSHSPALSIDMLSLSFLLYALPSLELTGTRHSRSLTSP